MNNKVILLIGPTATGKTELSLRLAKKYPLEIISVDSALIYRELNIGSAKPTIDELNAVPHHLINILSPLANYSVANFLTDCHSAIEQILARNKIPLLVGGTMMYYNALINGISTLPTANPELRQQLALDFINLGNQGMHERLAKLDPLTAAKIKINDRQRLERALEVCLITNLPLSQVQQQNKTAGQITHEYLTLGILPNNRELLHQRIQTRFMRMLELGLIEEVRQLQLNYPALSATHNSMRSVGYRQVWNYLANLIDYPQLIGQGIAATRQLAKRQITWLRSLPIHAIDDANLNIAELNKQIVTHINQFLNN